LPSSMWVQGFATGPVQMGPGCQPQTRIWAPRLSPLSPFRWVRSVWPPDPSIHLDLARDPARPVIVASSFMGPEWATPDPSIGLGAARVCGHYATFHTRSPCPSRPIASSPLLPGQGFLPSYGPGAPWLQTRQMGPGHRAPGPAISAQSPLPQTCHLGPVRLGSGPAIWARGVSPPDPPFGPGASRPRTRQFGPGHLAPGPAILGPGRLAPGPVNSAQSSLPQACPLGPVLLGSRPGIWARGFSPPDPPIWPGASRPRTRHLGPGRLAPGPVNSAQSSLPQACPMPASPNRHHQLEALCS
jgi:hypothetical protein